MSDKFGMKSSSCTQFEVIKFSHVWTIRNFSFCNKKIGECLESTLFSAGANNNDSEWCLTLYPNGSKEEFKEFLSLFVKLKSCNQKSVFVEIKFGLWHTRMKKFCFRHENGSMVDNKLAKRITIKMDPNNEYTCGIADFFRRDALLTSAGSVYLSDDDTLILGCEIRESLGTVSFSSEPNEHPFKFELGHHLELLFNPKKLSDVTLSVGDQEFSAHKTVLAAQSPVFAAMFEHDMIEQRQSRVTITDIAPSVVIEMLIFMYTNTSPNLGNMAKDLLAVADKYNLSKLKSVCENFLCEKITADNAADMLLAADLHAAEMLRARAIALISARATELKDTFLWKNMLSENANVVREAFLDIKRPRTN